MSYKKSPHTTYDLKYHIIWCSKYRYRILTGEVGIRTRELIREICATNYVDIISGSMSPDHIHLLVGMPPSLSISKLMQYVKGKSSRKLQMEFAHLKKRYWVRHESATLLAAESASRESADLAHLVSSLEPVSVTNLVKRRQEKL